MNRQPGTISSSLLGGIKESEDEAWARMTLLYAPLVYLWCRQEKLQSADAEDVVQEVLATVAQRVGDFQRNRAQGSFRGWLRKITHYKLGDFMRATRRQAHVSGNTALLDDLPTPETLRDPEETATEEETKLVFDRVLRLIQTKFEERTWRAFLRVVMDGAPPQQVAEEMELSVDSVYQAKSRVLSRVRRELRELGT